ncbi:MAG: hypothetical protein CL677_06840 [Bdellovibrionaceae bacterium]|nr:hypothetical protein [Pseudobdellovibrionaceae bacterium]
MAVCPKCGSSISDEFGLVNCGQCGSSVFVDLEGGVKLAEDMNSGSDFSSSSLDDEGSEVVANDVGEQEVYIDEEIPPGEGEWVEQNSVVQPRPDLHSEDYVPENLDEENYPAGEFNDYAVGDDYLANEGVDGPGEELEAAGDELLEELPSDPNSIDKMIADSVPEDPDQVGMEDYEDYLEVAEENGQDSNLAIEGDGYELEPVPQSTDESSMEDVRAFGNSELSSASQGSLKIKLKISGIDDPALRAELKEALTDGRFLWDEDDLMSNVVGGELIISGLSPVKATVLINRLKPVNVQLHWEQYVLQVNDSADENTTMSSGELEP